MGPRSPWSSGRWRTATASIELAKLAEHNRRPTRRARFEAGKLEVTGVTGAGRPGPGAGRAFTPGVAQGRAAHQVGPLTGTAALWVTAGALAWIYVLSTLPTPLYVDYRRAFHFSQITLTAAYAVYVVGSMTTMFFLGRLSDQGGRRPVVLASLAVGALAGVLFLVASSTVWLFVARIVSGLAIALASGACTAWIVELHPDRSTRQASQIAIGANLFGLGAGAILAGALAQFAAAPLRLVYVVFLASTPFVVAATALCSETVRHPRPMRDVSLRPRLGVPPDLRRAFAFPAMGAFATFSVLGFYAALLPSLLQQAFHDADHARSGGIVGGLFLAGVLIVAATPGVRARRGTVVGLALLVPGTGLLLLAQTLHSMVVLLLGTTIAGMGGGLGYRFGIQLINEIAPEDRRAEMVSAYLMVCYAAISLPIVGIGLVAAASSLLVADLVFGALVAMVAVVALAVGVRQWSK